MFTVRAAARELKISVSLVYRLCRSGRITHERYGLGRGVIRISAAALTAFRLSCTTGGTSLPHPKKKVTRQKFEHLKL